MYGLVNRALQELVCAHCGKAVWDQIRAKAEVKEEVFIRMDSCLDAVTYRLIDAASVVLQTPADVLLKQFGQHWMRYTSIEGYGALVNDMGRDFFEALAGLDAMHARVALLYPNLKTPHFRCTEISSESLFLHYHSERVGFAPMILGLIEGLGEKFGIRVSIEHVVAKGPEQDFDSFFIRLLGPMDHAF